MRTLKDESMKPHVLKLDLINSNFLTVVPKEVNATDLKEHTTNVNMIMNELLSSSLVNLIDLGNFHPKIRGLACKIEIHRS